MNIKSFITFRAFHLFLPFFIFCISIAHAAPPLASYRPKVTAEDSIYEIDPDHSSVTFRIRHLVSVVKGQFRQFKGQIKFDPQFKESAVQVVIDPASVDTNQEKRDEHLRSPEFLSVDKFPEIQFKSKRATPQIIVGDLTFLGITKEITLDYIYHGTTNDVKGHKRIGFSATGVINRKEFGLLYNQELTPNLKLLGDEVPIEIEIQAVLKTQ